MYTVCGVVDRFEKLQLDYTRANAEFQVKSDNFFIFFGIAGYGGFFRQPKADHLNEFSSENSIHGAKREFMTAKSSIH